MLPGVWLSEGRVWSVLVGVWFAGMYAASHLVSGAAITARPTMQCG
jgi:hypothetical protein